MKSIKSLALVIMWFAVIQIASANGFQPYEASSYPIRSRIEAINKIVIVIEARLIAPDLSREEKESRINCLHQYATEKKQLNEDLEAGRKVSQLPGVTFFTPETDQECTKGLTIQQL